MKKKNVINKIRKGRTIPGAKEFKNKSRIGKFFSKVKYTEYEIQKLTALN